MGARHRIAFAVLMPRHGARCGCASLDRPEFRAFEALKRSTFGRCPCRGFEAGYPEFFCEPSGSRLAIAEELGFQIQLRQFRCWADPERAEYEGLRLGTARSPNPRSRRSLHTNSALSAQHRCHDLPNPVER